MMNFNYLDDMDFRNPNLANQSVDYEQIMKTRGLKPIYWSKNYINTVCASKHRDGVYCSFFPVYPLANSINKDDAPHIIRSIPYFDRLMHMGYFYYYFARGKKRFRTVFMNLWKNGNIINPWTNRFVEKLGHDSLISLKKTFKLFPNFYGEMFAQLQGKDEIVMGVVGTGSTMVLSNFVSPVMAIGMGILGTTASYIFWGYWKDKEVKTSIMSGIKNVVGTMSHYVETCVQVVRDLIKDKVDSSLFKLIIGLVSAVVIYKLLKNRVIDLFVANTYIQSIGADPIPEKAETQSNGSSLLVYIVLLCCGVGIEKASRNYRSMKDIIKDTSEFFAPDNFKDVINHICSFLNIDPPFKDKKWNIKAKANRWDELLSAAEVAGAVQGKREQVLNQYLTWAKIHADEISEFEQGKRYKSLRIRTETLFKNKTRKVKARKRPLCVFLYGDSNAGKTYLANRLISMLLQTKFGVDADDVPDRIFPVNGSANFLWEGYDPSKHVAVLWDDFLQSKDTTSNANLVQELYTIMESTQVNLNQAFSKGSVDFGSRIMVFTSNQYTFENAGVISAEAFYKRCDIAIEVTRHTGGYGVEAYEFKNLPGQIASKSRTPINITNWDNLRSWCNSSLETIMKEENSTSLLTKRCKLSAEDQKLSTLRKLVENTTEDGLNEFLDDPDDYLKHLDSVASMTHEEFLESLVQYALKMKLDDQSAILQKYLVDVKAKAFQQGELWTDEKYLQLNLGIEEDTIIAALIEGDDLPPEIDEVTVERCKKYYQFFYRSARNDEAMRIRIPGRLNKGLYIVTGTEDDYEFEMYEEEIDPDVVRDVEEVAKFMNRGTKVYCALEADKPEVVSVLRKAKLRKIVKKVAIYMVGIVAAIGILKLLHGLMKGAYGTLSTMFAWFDDTDAKHQGGYYEKHAKGPKELADPRILGAKAQKEGSIPDIVTTKVSQNIFKFTAVTPEGRYTDHILMANGHYGFVATHSADRDIKQIILSLLDGSEIATVYEGQFRIFSRDEDHTTVIKFIRQISGISSLHKFIPEHDLTLTSGTVSRITAIPYKDRISYQSTGAIIRGMHKYTFNADSDPFTISGVVVNFGVHRTVPGDCGTPYISWTGADHRRIAWIHVGKSASGYALASSISIDRLKEAGFQVVEKAEYQSALEVVPFHGDYYEGLRGCCSFKNFSYPRVSKTQYEPSPFRMGEFAEVKTHIPLVDDPEVYQKSNRVKHYEDPGLHPVVESLMFGNEAELLQEFDHTDNSQLRELSDNEVIKGIYRLGAMDKDTSTGPFLMAKGVTKRTDVIDFDEGKIKNLEFRTQVENLYQAMGEEEPPELYAQIKNKDEPLPFRKETKRWYYSFTLCFLFVCRRIFGMFIALSTVHQMIDVSTVGINPHSIEWNCLYKDLRTHPWYLDSDFSKMDVTMKLYMFDLVSIWLCGLYGYVEGTVNYRRMRNIFKAAASPILIIGNSGYRCISLNSSGWLGTCLMSNVAGYVCRFISGFLILRSNMPCSYDWLRKNWVLKTFGDDLVMSASAEIKNAITPQEWADAIRAYFGMIVTGADKNGPGRWTSNIKEISFISRGFVVHNGLVLAPLADDSFNKMMHWVRNSQSVSRMEVLQSIIFTAHFEAIVKGKTFYDRFVKVMKPIFSQLGLKYTPRSWKREMRDYTDKYVGNKTVDFGEVKSNSLYHFTTREGV